MKVLMGRKFKIISENENYKEYKDIVLKCISATNELNSCGYDSSMYPEKLCSFILPDGKYFPFSLYEYEIESIFEVSNKKINN